MSTSTTPSIAEAPGFERLLAELSVRFVNLAADRVDSEIEFALGRICKALDIDRGLLWQAGQGEPGAFVLTHAYQIEGQSRIVRDADRRLTTASRWTSEEAAPAPVVLGLDARALFPQLLARVRSGETLVVCRLADLPPEAARDREMLQRFGTTANVTVPLLVGGELMGGLGLDMLGRDRDWSDVLLGRLTLVAQVFANALARRRADLALRASEERLYLAAESAGAGLWDLDVASGRIWATPGAKRLYGFDPGDDLDLPRILEHVHPDDRDAFRARLQGAPRQAAEYSAEYRLLLPNGDLRWINARGSPVGAGTSAEAGRLMGVSIDVTRQKQAELQLKEHQTRLATAVEAAGLGFYETRQGAELVFPDERMRSLTGAPPEETRVREFWLQHVHPEDRDRVTELSRGLLEGRMDRVAVQYRYRHPSGKVLWINHVSHLVERDADGSAARMVGVLQDITELKTREEELGRALEDVRRLSDQLQRENLYLRHEVTTRLTSPHIVGRSAAIQSVVEQAAQVAPTGSTVLLLGETGTGKERFASFIHQESPRRGRAMISVNCAAIPATLIESELFGREKGAYTGALSKQIGRFELAHGSTIFLDEIGELPTEVQVKLLRVLQERQVERLGSPRPVLVDVRIIAASNRNLERAARDGSFRQDLYYRLAVFPITVPPLRERLDDLPLLVEAIVEELAVGMGKRIDAVSRDSLAALSRYDWPGNVRELRNAIERALIVSSGPILEIETPGRGPEAPGAPVAGRSGRTMGQVEREHLLIALRECGWRIRGPRGAAGRLGIKPTTLEARMVRLGIQRPWKGGGKS